MNKAINEIKKLLVQKPNAVIGIDGNCAAGKSTFAATLSKQFGFQVIHTDDFFLFPEMRTTQRLSTPGGNIHHERFVNEVIDGIKSKTEFLYGVFDCRKGKIDKYLTVDPSLPIIIEGAYSLHPKFFDIYDLKIFFEIDKKTQLERIEKRNGCEALKTFCSKWIPLENKYFEFYGIKEKCDLCIYA